MAFAGLDVKAQTPDWGKPGEPFPIKNTTELKALRDCMNGSGTKFYFKIADSTFTSATPSEMSGYEEITRKDSLIHYKLMTDIDLNPGKNVAACDGSPNYLGGDPLEQWTPFNVFYGHLDGGFHIISGVLVLNPNEDKVGFFREISYSSSVKNLGIVNSYFYGLSRVGGIVGYMMAGTVTHCFVDAVLVGFMEASEVNNTNHVGGIVGEATSSTIDTCYTTGSITSRKNHLGGICGYGSTIHLTSCYSSMVINYSVNKVGGIAGELPVSGTNGSLVENCYYDKQMCARHPSDDVSYGEGMLTSDMLKDTWTVLGDNFVYTSNYYPMLKGFDATNPYVKLSTVPILLPETPSVQTIQSLTENFTLGGGSDVIWKSTEERYVKVTGSAAEVYNQGWLQLVDSLSGKTHTVELYTHNLPKIGTEGNPFPIDDYNDLTIFRNGVNGDGPFNYKHYVVPSRAVGTWFQQTHDISLDDVDNWQGDYRIGKDLGHAFAGVYDGGGNAITDLKITSGDNSGFFGYIDGGSVKNLDIVVSAFTPGTSSGPLCSQISGVSSVDNCRSFPAPNKTVVLQLKDRSSGLIGLTTSFKGTISNCQNHCDISAVGSINYLGGVIGYNEKIDSIVIRGCQNHGSITGIQTSVSDIKVDKVGGITAQLEGKTGHKVWFDSCTNYGTITALNNSKWTQVGGIFARCPDTLSITITYCSNYGNLTSSHGAAGIADEVKGGSTTLSHCVNAGDIWVKDIGQTRPGAAYGIIRSTDVYSSLNAGKVTADVAGSAFGITNHDSYDCINAGEVTSHSERWASYPLNSWDKGTRTSARNLNIGRINGVQAFWGTVQKDTTTNVCDKQMVFDAHTSDGNISKKETAKMLGTQLQSKLGSNWVYTDGMYPRIKGLENLPISIVTATPVIFGTGQTINSVDSNFYVGCSIPEVEWKYNGQTVSSPCTGNKKKVEVGMDTLGVKTLTVTYDGITKTVRFCRKVKTPKDTLTVTDIADLRILRNGVNSGGPFDYKGTKVPARAAGTKFKQTTSINMSGDVNWEPIGKVDAQFNGTYLGDTIRNLQQENMQNGGLFGWGYYATVKDLHIVNVKMSNIRSCAGAIMAVGNYANIKNCSASGEIKGYKRTVIIKDETLENNLGGILGNGYYTTVTSCVNYCKMTGYELSCVGGIVGRGYYTSNNTSNMVDSCANYAVITGDYTLGGVVGGNSNVIKNSYNAGEVIGSEFAVFVGGLTGHGAYVENSFNTAMVTAAPSTIESYVGGLVGQVRNSSVAEIFNSYNAGIVEANRMYVGGIFGGSIKKDEWNGGTGSTVNIKVHHNYVCNAVNSNGTYVGAILGYNVVDPGNVQIDTNKKSSLYGFQKIYHNYYDTTFCYAKGIGCNGTTFATDASGQAEGLGTRQMVGDTMKNLLGANNTHFTYGDTNFYPRGLGNVANWPASLAASARLQLQYGQRSKSVDSNFTVGGCASGVSWGLKDGGNAIIFKNNKCDSTHNQCAAEIQTLGVVYAQSSYDGIPYKAIKLHVGNSVTNPIVIKDKTQLILFRNFINAGKEFFYNIDDKTFHASDAGIEHAFPITDQGNDLYFKLTYNMVDLSDINDWTPIGTSKLPFKGHFNGGNHTITGMKCTAAGDTIGFFGYLDGGSIDSLYFTYAEISGAGSYKGVVCGYNNKGDIRKCKSDNATITLTGPGNSWGGICGYNNVGKVMKCTSNECIITGANDSVVNVGGVIGYGFDGKADSCIITNLEFVGSNGINNGGICGMVNKFEITDCHVRNSTFTFSAKNGGGICGRDTCGSIRHCSFINSTIYASKGSIGGILGDGYCGDHSYDIYIEDCYTDSGYVQVENGWCVGGLIGSISQQHNTFVYVNGCRNNIPVEGNQYVGGIAGQFGGEMRNCYNTANVKGNSIVGGLIGGSSTHSYMWDNYNIGDVEASGDYAGGLIGWNPILQINNSFNSGRVKGKDYVGGLTGESGSVERYSYNAGQVYGGFYVGGLTGHKYYYDNNAADTSKENYNIGYVYGNNLVGALFGTVDNAGMVKNNYYDKQFSYAVGIGGQDVEGKATGKLTSEMTGTQLSLGNEWVTVDSLYPQVKNLQASAFSTKASLATATPFILPKSMVAWNVDSMAVKKDSLRGLTPAGTKWETGDGSMVLKTVDNRKFTIRKVGILDVVAYNPTPDSLYKRVRLMVEISEEYPIIIKDYTQLSKFRDFIDSGSVFYYDADNEVFYSDNDAYFRRIEIPAGGESMFFKLAKDIDFSFIPSANPWTPIGSINNPFKGHFNGGGTTISNLTISDASGDYHGFFGYSTGTIQNLNVLNANVTGRQYTAAVCGFNNGGSIIHCASIGGTVTGTGFDKKSYTGGICGNSENGTINACYNSAYVTGLSYVAGICARIENGVASECFNMGRIEAPNDTNYNYCGGIAGRNTALLSDCYNTGVISGGKNVGGVIGLNKKEGLTRIYNAGTVTAPGVVGGLANAYTIDYNSTDTFQNGLAYYPAEMYCYTDGMIAPGVGSVNTDTSYKKEPYDLKNQVVPSKVTTKPQTMVGTALQNYLGTDKWVFSDSLLYPRLKIFATGPDSMASYVSASPVLLNEGQTVRGVTSAFKVYDHFKPGQAEDLTWELARPSDALDTTYANTTGVVSLRGCEEVTIKVFYDSLEREVDLLVKSDRSYLYKDTTCGESYLWAYNQQYYSKTDQYPVEITYGSGCHEINTLELVVPDPLSITLTPGISCTGENQGSSITATVTGGISPSNYSYQWSMDEDSGFNSNEASPTGLAPGTYTVTVTDLKNTKHCQATKTITIGTPALLKVEDVAIKEPCYNDNNGTVSLNIQGGNAPYKISWSSYLGDTGSDSLAVAGTFTKNNVAHDTLTFTITDANGCSLDTIIRVAGDTNKYEIIAYSETKTYDGIKINPQQYKLKVNGVESSTWFTPTNPAQLGGDTTLVVKFEHTDSLVNAGVTANNIDSVIVILNNDTITCRLNVKKTNGSIVINKKEVTLRSESITEICTTTVCTDVSASSQTVYDGNVVVTKDKYGISFSGWSAQDGLGSRQNTFNYSIENDTANNYTFTKQYGRLSVIQEGLVMVFADTVEKIYDGQPLRPTFTVIGLKPEHTVSFKYKVGGVSAESPVTGLGNDSTHHPVSGPYVKDSGSKSVEIYDFEITYGSNQISYTDTTIINGQLIITPRNITLHSNTNSKVYDGTPLTDTAVTIEGDYNGLFASQVENLKALPQTNPLVDHTTDSVPNKIKYKGKEGSEYNANNYNVDMVEGKLYIDQRPATYKGETRTVPFTGSKQCIDSIIVSGLLDGDSLKDVTFNVCGTAPGTYVGTDQGLPQGTAVVKHGETDVTDNYALTAEPGSLTIVGSQQQLVIRSKTDTSLYYDGQTHKYQTYYVTYGGANINPIAESGGKKFKLISDDTLTITITEGSTGDTGITHVPAAPLKNDFGYTLNHPDNYSNVIADTGVISLKPRLVRIVSDSLTKIYDGEPFDSTTVCSTVSIKGMGFVGQDGIDLEHVSWPKLTQVNVGTYPNLFNKPAFANGTNPNDYDTTLVYGPLTINKAILTVKAVDTSYTYGDPVQELKYTVTGFKGTDNASVLTGGEPALSGSFDSDSPVGAYDILISKGTLAADNYDFNFENGTMLVTYRPIRIEAKPIGADNNLVYNGAPFDVKDSVIHYDTTYHEFFCNIHKEDLRKDGPNCKDTVTAVKINGSARLAGHYSNAINITSCVILKKGTNDTVTNNYMLTSVDTFIHIKQKPLKITVSSEGEYYYDGQPHTVTDASGYTVGSGNNDSLVVNGTIHDDIAHIEFIGSGTAARQNPYPISVDDSSLFITNSELEQENHINVKNSYAITCVAGELTIHKDTNRIKIKSGNKTDFEYSGEPLQWASYEVTYGNETHGYSSVSGPTYGTGGKQYFILPTKDTLTITPDTSITKPSENFVPNKFSYSLKGDTNYKYQPDTTCGLLGINSVATQVVVSSGSKDFNYDGLPHAYRIYTVKFGNDTIAKNTADTVIRIPATGHYVNITPRDSVIEQGEHANTFAYKIIDSVGTTADNVSAMYVNKDTIPGLLRILSPALTLTAPSASKTYDGDPLTCASPVTVTGLPEGFTIEATASGSQTDAGSSNNVVSSYIIKKGGEDVTSNFTNVTKYNGTLTVSKRTVTFSVPDSSVEYNGSLHYGKLVYTFTNVVEGQEATVKYTPAQGTVVGTYDNAVVDSFKVMNGNQIVTGNYTLGTPTKGKLTITNRTKKYELTVTAKSSLNNVYDGESHSVSGFDTLRFKAENNKIYTVSGLTTSSPSLTDVGTAENIINGTAVVRDSANNDVTAQFIVHKQNGTLSIIQRHVTLKANDVSKQYTGSTITYLTADNAVPPYYTIANKTSDNDSLVTGHSITAITLTGEGTLVGNHPIQITDVKIGANNSDYTSNYHIHTVDGTLTITPPPLEVIARDSAKTYDGTPLPAPYTVNAIGLGTPSLRYKVKDDNGWSDYFETIPSITDADTILYLVEATAGNYSVSDTAQLSIAKREVTVSVGDTVGIQYTGGEHESTKDPVFNNVVYGQPSIEYNHAKGTLVGTYYGQYVQNTFKVMANNVDVTKNYKLTDSFKGKLTIIDRTPKYDIMITANSDTNNIYDGIEHSAIGYDSIVHVGEQQFHFKVYDLETSNPHSTDVCDLTNAFIGGTAVVKDEDGNDVTAQFNVSTTNGKLKISKRHVFLKSSPGIKMYNGTPLILNSQENVFAIDSLGSLDFVAGEGATYNITGSQTFVGISPNTFTYTLNSNTKATNYTIDTTYGTLTVTPDTCKIRISSESKAWVFDGETHRHDVYNVTYNSLPVSPIAGSNGNIFVLNEADTLIITSTFNGIIHVDSSKSHNNTFTYTLQHSDQYTGTRDTTYGSLTILPEEVTVVFKGNFSSITYDGSSHSVWGYHVESISSSLYHATDFKFNRNDTISRLNAGITYMNLLTSDFENLNHDFNVTFHRLYDGFIEIVPEGQVNVYIEGNHYTCDYDGEPHTVTGFKVVQFTSSNYSSAYVQFQSPNNDISDTSLTRTTVGTDSMRLRPEKFSNTSGNFTNVQFIILINGYLTINHREVKVDIFGHQASQEYDGTEHTISGYHVVSSYPSLYTTSSFEFHGDSIATQQMAGVDSMHLDISQFVNTDPNFNVIFEVLEDGYQEITKNTTALTLTCPSVSKTYDGIALSQAAEAQSSIQDNQTFLIQYKTKLQGQSTFSGWSTDTPSITNHGVLLVEVNCSNPNYATKDTSYTLTVNKRVLEMTSADAERIYNGDWLTNQTVTVTGDDFVTGEGASYNVTGQQLLPGYSPNVFTYTLNSNTLANNYLIDTTYGTLHVFERPYELRYPITVVSNSNPPANTSPIIYDGLKHSDSNFVQLSFTTVDNHTYTVKRLSAKVSAFDAGTYLNTIQGLDSVEVLDEYNNNVTTQFNIQYEEGKLVISQRPITITVPSEYATMMYNGDSLRVDFQNITITTLAERDTLKSGYIITEGYTKGTYYCNDGFFRATDIAGVASQHDFSITHGASAEYDAGSSMRNYDPGFSVALTITKRPLEITASSAEKVYDGEPLTLTTSDYTLTNNTSLAPTDTLIITRSGVQTCVGDTANHITSVTVLHKGDWIDVTSSYDITMVDGLLKVTPMTTGLTCPDTVKITLVEDTYDTIVPQSLLGTATHSLVNISHATVGNNLDDLNPLTAGTHTITWTLYDDCDSAMTTCEQLVVVNYTPCEGFTFDGHFYGAKRIGFQCWLTENLRNNVDQEGNVIANFHAYKDNPDNLEKFGYLYSWYAAMNIPENDNTAALTYFIGDNGRPYVQGNCPNGWAVGNLTDYTALFETVVDASLLKDAGDGYWIPGLGGTLPNSGFNARANGFFNSSSQRYEDLLTGSHLWMPEGSSSVEIVNSTSIQYYCNESLFQLTPKSDLKGVRCIRKVAP